jgi:hypothetical protein
MQWPVMLSSSRLGGGRNTAGHYGEFLQIVAKLDGAGAELDGPTANLDGCATAGGGSGCTTAGGGSGCTTAGGGRAREWMGVKRVVGSCRIGIFSYLVHGKGWVSEVE